MLLIEATDSSFFIELLEKGGLPALAIGILFTIFFFWIRSESKLAANREVENALERKDIRIREAKQYEELMMAYEGIVENFITLSTETTKVLTRLNDRIGQCPVHENRGIVVDDDRGDE